MNQLTSHFDISDRAKGSSPQPPAPSPNARPTLAPEPIPRYHSIVSLISWVMFTDLVKIMTDTQENGQPDKLSPVEIAKAASNYLRGTIAEELRDSNEFVSKASTQLLKHHGTYQQDDRERRTEARVDGPPKAKFYSFMVRTAIPGGRLTSDQLLAELDLCDEVGNTTLRITTRQGLQLHGVLKTNLKRTIQRINEVQLSTLAACGDVKRNVMCTPCPYNGDPVHEQMYELAGELVQQLNPRTRAYHQIWLTNGETGETVDVGEVGLPPTHPAGPATPGDDPVEPIYGKTYLPRKFKIAVGLPGDNSVDVYANDIGLLGDLRGLERRGLQRAGGRQLRRDAQRQENLPNGGTADVLHRRGPRGRPVHRDREGAARFRQPGRSQSGPHEVSHHELGPRSLSRRKSRSTSATRSRRCGPSACTDSTTAWAGTNRATAAGSTA